MHVKKKCVLNEKPKAKKKVVKRRVK